MRPSSTYEGLKKGIAIGLDIGEDQISIKKLSDLADPPYPGNLLNPEGHAIGTRLEEYVERLNDITPMFWGHVIADESIWDVVDKEYSGFSYLPHLFDASASGFLPGDWQPGIGDGGDLKVAHPIEIEGLWYPRAQAGYFYILPIIGKGQGESPLGEYYLYSRKETEMIPSGTLHYVLASGTYQGAPIVITSARQIATQPTEPWARIDGPGVYRKKAQFTKDANGVIDSSLNEFQLAADASGKITFNKPLEENVVVEYESSSDIHYPISNLPLTPQFTGRHSGFLFIGHISSPGDWADRPCELIISLYTFRTMLNSTYEDRAELLASVYDLNLNPVKGIEIIFEIQDSALGRLEARGLQGSSVTNITDIYGQTNATYIVTVDQRGLQRIKAFFVGCPVNYDKVELRQDVVIVKPFILGGPGVQGSLLDSLDYLT